MCLVVNWFVHCQAPLCGNAHHQECFHRNEDCPQGVPEVRVDDSQVSRHDNILINDDNRNENNIAGTESNQTLMECCLDCKIAYATYSNTIAKKPSNCNPRDSNIGQPGSGCGVGIVIR